ncbi:unnamed protein product [Haemonchus placei]|uniref:Ion channel n=1 Tax=Haemonchus placei TaxID=6290 RepID=A0A158QQ98_HAEPC|nr:unnamed protein product [Haemonchus placei]
MERSGMNSLPETLHDAQKSILKSNKKPTVMVAITEPSTSEDRLKQHDDHHSRQCDGTVAVLEQKISKLQTAASTVMPTPTSTERKFTDSFYWMSHLHKKVGLSHIILLVVLATYSALGAVVFYYLETPNERIVVAARKELLDDRIEQLAEHLTGMAENKTIEELAVDVKAAYIDMLNTEGSYKWSTFYRSDDPRNNYKWTYASSFFFAMNVYTTTGYGSIAPETRSGQWFVIIYGFIFVPVTLVVIRDLGQWLLLVITRNYAKILLKCRRKSNNLNEVIRLPILFSCVIMLGFIGFCTVFIYYLDACSGPAGSGLDWFHSMYFSYMSFTTIGLGDVMPSNATASEQLKPKFR